MGTRIPKSQLDTTIPDTGFTTITNLEDATIESYAADSSGRASEIKRTDGSVEIGYLRAAGMEFMSTSNDDYIKASVATDGVKNYVLEDALGPDGCVPDLVLGRWAARYFNNLYQPVATPTTYVWIIAGQSNSLQAESPPATLYRLDNRLLRTYRSIQGTVTPFLQSEVSLGTEFARDMLTYLPPNSQILICQIGAGSTGFTTTSLSPAPSGYTTQANGTWDRTLTSDPLNLYTLGIPVINAAMAVVPNPILMGMLWSQGEADSKLLNQSAYAAKLDDLFGAFRTDLSAYFNVSYPALNILVGSMTPEFVLLSAGTNPYVNDVQKALQDTPRRLYNVAYVPGPQDLFLYQSGSDIHWSAAGELVRGKMFSQAWRSQKAQFNVTSAAPAPVQNLDAKRSGTECIITWALPSPRVTSATIQYSTDTGTTWTSITGIEPLATTATLTISASLPLWLRGSTTNDVGTSNNSLEVHR